MSRQFEKEYIRTNDRIHPRQDRYHLDSRV